MTKTFNDRARLQMLEETENRLSAVRVPGIGVDAPHLYARAAIGVAEAMAKKADRTFDIIRDEPEYSAAFLLGVWDFTEKFAKIRLGIPEHVVDQDLRRDTGMFAVMYSALIFELYNDISGGEPRIAIPGENYSDTEAEGIKTDAFSFFEVYMEPQLKLAKAAKPKAAPRKGGPRP